MVSGDLTLNNPAKEVLDLLRELQSYVGALNTALFGACSVLALKYRNGETSWGSVERYAIMLALVGGAVSYYGLYLSRIAILEMVSAGVIDPFTRRLQVALELQYYGFLAGILLIGFVFVRAMDKPHNASQR